MPALPKPKRINLDVAREYIQNSCNLKNPWDCNPSLFDALCNGELYFEGEFNIPANYEGMVSSSKEIEPIPFQFWKYWGYDEFLPGGKLNKSEIPLPNIRYKPNAPFYCNLTIATADIDTWLNARKDSKVGVRAVPEKVYEERVEKALSTDTKYSRTQDRAWAKYNGYSIESVDAARKKYAPKEWSLKGRPKTPK